MLYDTSDCSFFEYYIGDGICNDFLNEMDCQFDGGDCCLHFILDQNCSECMCHLDGERRPSVLSQESSTVISISQNQIGSIGDNNIKYQNSTEH